MDPTTILSAPPTDRLTLQALAKEQNVSPVTCWRWTLRGVHGVRLPSIKVGNKRLTLRSLFFEWCRQVTAVADGQAGNDVREDTHREDVVERADCEADRLLRLITHRKEEAYRSPQRP